MSDGRRIKVSHGDELTDPLPEFAPSAVVNIRTDRWKNIVVGLVYALLDVAAAIRDVAAEMAAQLEKYSETTKKDR